MRVSRFGNISIVMLLAFAMAASFGTMGCASKGQTGAVAGAGLGALIGQAIGRNTAGTLIGAGVGTGLGYIIGNEMDKSDAKKREDARARAASSSAPPPAPRTGLLGGTKWKAIEVVPPPTPPHKSYTLRFAKDGWLHSREVYMDGSVKTDKERYRVEGDTLILNKPGYLVNAKYKMTNNTLTVRHDKVKVVFALVN
jgi:hypothetical protein